MVGRTTSGAYGHHAGSSVALGYVHHPDGVTREFIEQGAFEIEVAGQRFGARGRLSPLYDPKGVRLRS